MLNLLSIISIVFLSSVTQAPTKEETVDFLIGKFSCEYERDEQRNEMRLEFNYIRSEFYLFTKSYSKKSKDVYYYKVVIPIKMINPNNIEIIEIGDMGWIEIYTNNDSQIIKTYVWKNLNYNLQNDENAHSSFTSSKLAINVPKERQSSNPNLLPRLKKAIINLIDMTGGKGEKY